MLGKVIICFGPNIICVFCNLLFEFDFLCYNLIVPSIFFTLWAEALLYDLPFNSGSNIYTVLDALDDRLKSDPYVDTIVSLT